MKSRDYEVEVSWSRGIMKSRDHGVLPGEILNA